MASPLLFPLSDPEWNERQIQYEIESRILYLFELEYSQVLTEIWRFISDLSGHLRSGTIGDPGAPAPIEQLISDGKWKSQSVNNERDELDQTATHTDKSWVCFP